MEFHDEYPQYEILAKHSEEEGKHKRKVLWKVFWIMLIITIVELVIGFYNKNFPKMALEIIFIGFTILKAGYIVMAFMHLGHENKALKLVILGPFCGFILYLIYMAGINEGNYSNTYKDLIDPLLTADTREKAASEQAEEKHE